MTTKNGKCGETKQIDAGPSSSEPRLSENKAQCNVIQTRNRSNSVEFTQNLTDKEERTLKGNLSSDHNYFEKPKKSFSSYSGNSYNLHKNKYNGDSKMTTSSEKCVNKQGIRKYTQQSSGHQLLDKRNGSADPTRENQERREFRQNKNNSVKYKINTLDVIKELKRVVKDENAYNFEKMSLVLSGSHIIVKYEVLSQFIDLVSQISIGESSLKPEILQLVFSKYLLDAMILFLQESVDSIITHDKKSKNCEMILKKFLDLSRLAAELLPTSSLDFLKHTLVFIKTTLYRLQDKINFNHQHFGDLVTHIGQKAKQEEFEMEKLSLSDIEIMKNMSILPTVEDLFEKTPDLKKNIVEGAYKNTDHYLTVQFTLLHEDFVAPLREGVATFLSSSKKKTQVAIYHQVRITEATTISGKFGHVIQLDRKVNWELVTQFVIFGSLLLFTTNDFKSFFTGIVIDADKGNRTINVKLNSDHHKVCCDVYAQEFVMAVSKVFFEPYYHVLKALQKMSDEEFPMKKYIVEVCSEPQPPAYIGQLGLDRNNISEQTTADILSRFRVNINTEKLNPSQHKAFQAALTKEFVAIQGPPGTGKTFLGLQIVSALLDNVATGTPILIVCYKNHALDQFLEGILDQTKALIRIGGRSKNEELKQYNLKDLRGSYGYRQHEKFLQTLAVDYFLKETQIDDLRKHGIVSVQNVLPYVVSPKFRGELLSVNLEDWLMEGVYVDGGYGNDNEDEFDDFLDESENISNGVSNKEIIDLISDANYAQINNTEQIDCPTKTHDLKTQAYGDTGNILFSTNPIQQGEGGNQRDNVLSAIEKNELKLEYNEFNQSYEELLKEQTLNSFKSRLDDEEDYCSKSKIILEKNQDPVVSSLGTGKENNCGDAQSSCNPSVDSDTISETQKKQDRKSSTKFNLDDKSYCFSGESEKRLVETYTDDYSNVYNDVSKEVDKEKLFNNGYSEGTRNNQNNFSKLDPQFTLTISFLQQLHRDYEKRIQMLLANETIDYDEWNHCQFELKTCLKDLENRIYFLQRMLSKKPNVKSTKIKKLYALVEHFGIGALSNCQRWYLYHSWLDSFVDDIKGEMIKLEESIRFGERQLDKARGEANLKALRKAKVVGVTTSGAAANRSTLNKLGAKIVVIEEAAEVLESHIVTSLSSKCQHLILIGDHKQLRPNPAVYQLCAKYNLDVSLFERMVRNGLNCYTLDVQHRMRPEFASLIVPSIYPHLENHLSTENRPNIRGIHHNLYFINHNCPEEKLRATESHLNKFEAEFSLQLANYLLLQGYTADDITIIATYSGQVKTMIKMRNPTFPQDLRITTVDDFQGEENKIIILSLVRSNAEGKIGFLKIENRVCVALSRAREGLYIIGNMDCLTENSQIWPQVKERLLEHNALGPTLGVYCQNHQETITLVRDGGMFRGMPEGGCSKMCEVKLSCGHVCKYHCHPRDQQHTDRYMCSQPCERKPCRWKHLCTNLCGEDCGPCMWEVDFNLTCGHVKRAECSSDPDVLRTKCHEVVSYLKPCGHASTKLCSVTRKEVTYMKCQSACSKPLPCGHVCFSPCGHWRNCAVYPCRSLVEVTPKCGHKVLAICCGKTDPICYEKIEKTLDCGHTHLVFCYNFEMPIYCSEEVEKKLNCEHSQLVQCGAPADRVSCSKLVLISLPCGHGLEVECRFSSQSFFCQRPCQKTLGCGHVCMKMCSESCFCTSVIEQELLCGHKVRAQCGTTKVTCDHPCGLALPCGHWCQGRCGERCGISPCQVPTLSRAKPACSHEHVMIPCFYNQIVPEISATQLADLCTAKCAVMLPCKHNCSGECNSCRVKGTHAACDQPCRESLPCGHQCPKKCSEACGGCYERCLNRCSHKKCDRVCGDPCDFCQEPCDRGCVHKRCSRPCFALCDRQPCSLPCPAPLACGHPCLGFCGELCPPLCLQCDPQMGMQMAIRGDVPSRLLVLEDCGHIVDAVRMDVVFGRNKSVTVKCPIMSCQTPIITTKRYHKEVAEAFFHIMNLKRQMEVNKRENCEQVKQINQNSSYHQLRLNEAGLRNLHISSPRFSVGRDPTQGGMSPGVTRTPPFFIRPQYPTQVIHREPLGPGFREPWIPRRETTPSCSTLKEK